MLLLSTISNTKVANTVAILHACICSWVSRRTRNRSSSSNRQLLCYCFYLCSCSGFVFVLLSNLGSHWLIRLLVCFSTILLSNFNGVCLNFRTSHWIIIKCVIRFHRGLSALLPHAGWLTNFWKIDFLSKLRIFDWVRYIQSRCTDHFGDRTLCYSNH